MSNILAQKFTFQLMLLDENRRSDMAFLWLNINFDHGSFWIMVTWVILWPSIIVYEEGNPSFGRGVWNFIWPRKPRIRLETKDAGWYRQKNCARGRKHACWVTAYERRSKYYHFWQNMKMSFMPSWIGHGGKDQSTINNWIHWSYTDQKTVVVSWPQEEVGVVCL